MQVLIFQNSSSFRNIFVFYRLFARQSLFVFHEIFVKIQFRLQCIWLSVFRNFTHNVDIKGSAITVSATKIFLYKKDKFDFLSLFMTLDRRIHHPKRKFKNSFII